MRRDWAFKGGKGGTESAFDRDWMKLGSDMQNYLLLTTLNPTPYPISNNTLNPTPYPMDSTLLKPEPYKR